MKPNSIVFMEEHSDVSTKAIENRFNYKKEQFKQYLHHFGFDVLITKGVGIPFSEKVKSL